MKNNTSWLLAILLLWVSSVSTFAQSTSPRWTPKQAQDWSAK